MTQAARERANQTMQKTYKSRVKRAGDRRRTFTISTSDVDRDGDRITFWRLDLYRRNPVVLYAHNNRGLPIARASSVVARDGKLRSTAQFPEPGVSELSDDVLQLIDAGLLNAASIGFIPLKPVERNDHGGYNMGAEVTEWSVVPVPANPEALVERARAKGVSTSCLRRVREAEIRSCARGSCSSSTEGDLVEDLLSLSDAQVRELAGEIADDVYRRVLTPRTGRLP